MEQQQQMENKDGLHEGNETQGNEEGFKEENGKEGIQEKEVDRAARKAEHDFLKWKHENKQLKSQLEEMKSQLENTKKAEMIKQEQYKELWESEAKRVESLANEKKTLEETLFNSLKMKEIEKAALQSGIKKEAVQDLDILDTSDIVTETTSTGRINVLGVEDFVEKLKGARPHWFQSNKPPTVNTGNPEFNTGKTASPLDLLKLQKENPAKYQEEMKKRYALR